MLNWPRRCALALVLGPAVVIGQSPPEPLTFRSGVQTVELDVLVTDKSGKPVRGLTQDDFTLIEHETAQQISTFKFVDLPIIPPATRKASVRAVEPDVVTNTGIGRMYVMVLTWRGARVRLSFRIDALA